MDKKLSSLELLNESSKHLFGLHYIELNEQQEKLLDVQLDKGLKKNMRINAFFISLIDIRITNLKKLIGE